MSSRSNRRDAELGWVPPPEDASPLSEDLGGVSLDQPESELRRRQNKDEFRNTTQRKIQAKKVKNQNEPAANSKPDGRGRRSKATKNQAKLDMPYNRTQSEQSIKNLGVISTGRGGGSGIQTNQIKLLNGLGLRSNQAYFQDDGHQVQEAQRA